MRNVASISRLRMRAVMLLGVPLLAIAYGWAQEAQPRPNPSSSDPFATYHNSLASTADRLLAVAPEHLAETSQDRHVDSPALPEVTPSNSIRLTQAVSRVQQLRPVIEPILRQEGVPSEVAAVAL